MLSATYSITDAKARLGQVYSYYGYSDDNAMVAAITIAFDEAKLLDLVPLIGDALYLTVQAKNKSGLTNLENYIYTGEIYLALSRFLDLRIRATMQSQGGQIDEIQVEGYRRRVEGTSGIEKVSLGFFMEGKRCLGLAGYPFGLRRGDTGFLPDRNRIPDIWSGLEV